MGVGYGCALALDTCTPTRNALFASCSLHRQRADPCSLAAKRGAYCAGLASVLAWGLPAPCKLPASLHYVVRTPDPRLACKLLHTVVQNVHRGTLSAPLT